MYARYYVRYVCTALCTVCMHGSMYARYYVRYVRSFLCTVCTLVFMYGMCSMCARFYVRYVCSFLCTVCVLVFMYGMYARLNVRYVCTLKCTPKGSMNRPANFDFFLYRNIQECTCQYITYCFRTRRSPPTGMPSRPVSQRVRGGCRRRPTRLTSSRQYCPL